MSDAQEDTPDFYEAWSAAVQAADPLNSDATIHQRIIWLQGLIRGVGKGGYQSQDKYNFRRIDDVMNTIHVPLCLAGLYIQPVEVDIRAEEWTVWRNFNREFWVKMLYRIVGPNGDFVEIPATGNAINSSDKGVAAAKSYAFKQMISQLLSLPTDDPSADVEHSDHDMTPATWWESSGWASEEAAITMRDDLVARTRDLPEVSADAWREWAASQETRNDGPLYSTQRKRIASQISPVLARAWSDCLAELEESPDLDDPDRGLAGPVAESEEE